MSNYKMIIQYDGTRYKGWQGQNSTDMTIEGRIEAVLSAMVGYPVELTGSGRTDAAARLCAARAAELRLCFCGKSR